ncbi:Uncharacterised protein (plasmid) [Legionella adelaidensis]|uniref:Uncharacterized protein n=1 Tax=Legionella adelaidensis TaxID=45056 RepID=A0A0W0R5N0_9GAMM|nr:hypothetical protein [Legionella adelaidensis]KTC66404.1 hypothetical protein Lade_1062 [Legionella adelaidensis]VEH85002.1 Uncharacterised protein [Legionella adelaidensis]
MHWLIRIFIILGISSLNGCGYDKIANREIINTPAQKNIFYIENDTCLDVTHTRIRCY